MCVRERVRMHFYVSICVCVHLHMSGCLYVCAEGDVCNFPISLTDFYCEEWCLQKDFGLWTDMQIQDMIMPLSH